MTSSAISQQNYTPRGNASQGKSGMSTSTQANHQVIIHRCLYTHDLVRKSKRWQDGTIHFHTFNRRMRVYDLSGNVVGDMHDQDGRRSVEEGEYITGFGGGIHVDVSEQMQVKEPDLSGLFEKRQPKPITETPNVEQPTTAIPSSGMARISNPTSVARSDRTALGPLHLPIKSPYDQRQIDRLQPVQSVSDLRKRKLDDREDEHVPIRQLLSKTRPGGVYGQVLQVSNLVQAFQTSRPTTNNKRRRGSGAENNSPPQQIAQVESVKKLSPNNCRGDQLVPNLRLANADTRRPDAHSIRVSGSETANQFNRPSKQGSFQDSDSHERTLHTAVRTKEGQRRSRPTRDFAAERGSANELVIGRASVSHFLENNEQQSSKTSTSTEPLIPDHPARVERDACTLPGHSQQASIDSPKGDDHRKKEKLRPLELPSTRRKRKNLLFQALYSGPERSERASASHTDLQPSPQAEESLQVEAADTQLPQNVSDSLANKIPAQADILSCSSKLETSKRVHVAPLLNEPEDDKIRCDPVLPLEQVVSDMLSSDHEQLKKPETEPSNGPKNLDLTKSTPSLTSYADLDASIMIESGHQRRKASQETDATEVNETPVRVSVAQAGPDGNSRPKLSVTEVAQTKTVGPLSSVSRSSEIAASKERPRIQATDHDRKPPRSLRRAAVVSKPHVKLHSRISEEQRQQAVAEVQDPWSVEAWDLLGFLPPDKPFAAELNGTDKVDADIRT